MAEPFIGEIRIFGFPFAPRGWAFCNGQTMQIPQNTALFSILGTTFGGNGTSTYNLPDFRDRAALHAGQGPDLSPWTPGKTAGERTITLTMQQMAAHTHTPLARNDVGDTPSPANNALARGTGYYQTNSNPPLVTMAADALGVAGQGVPHDNLQPYLALNVCIALAGIYPARA